VYKSQTFFCKTKKEETKIETDFFSLLTRAFIGRVTIAKFGRR